MSTTADWALAYARQAEADFKAWERYEQYPEAVATNCHRLLFLQMACEKLCKAFRIRAGSPPENLQTSHGYIANPLPIVIRRQIVDTGRSLQKMQGLLTLVRYLAAEIEILSPAITRDGRRPDNCEYPWKVGEKVISPLDWTFLPSRLVTVRGGPTFIKLLKGAIDRTLGELENYMSGPIIRKYGFPNFDEIFGKKEPQHGVDEPEKTPAEPAKDAPAPAEKPAGSSDPKNEAK